jgi:DNA-binding IclR family transcriptional regulator
VVVAVSLPKEAALALGFSVVQNKPAYAITSVDSALLLAVLLRQEGPLRVTDAARRLGVSVSTAHRLLGMLIYRDFAVQLGDRRYAAGPVWLAAPGHPGPTVQLRELALSHLQRLVALTRETANLLVLDGDLVRFVATVECDQVLRVGDRTGRSLPARLASGGRALLAELCAEELAETHPGLAAPERETLARELDGVRRLGFAINREQTEQGLTAVGVAVPGPDADGSPPLRAALSVSMPTARFSEQRLAPLVSSLLAAARAVAADIPPAPPPAPPTPPAPPAPR